MTDLFFELHARSAFSFLEGASTPEELTSVAAELDIPGLAILDRDGVYGAPRFHIAAREAGIRAHIGAEITLQGGARLPVLVENKTGYKNLCRLITTIRMRPGPQRGATEEDLRRFSSGLICLTGDQNGPAAHALRNGFEEALKTVNMLADIFGPDRIYCELQRHFDRDEEYHTQAIAGIAEKLKLPLLASNGACYALASERKLLDILTCVRNRTNLQQAGRLLCRNSERHLKPHRLMEQLFRDYPGAIAATRELSSRLEFTLDDPGYRFPEYPVPAGENMSSYLRKVTEEGARHRYRPFHEKARRQIKRELDLIEKLGMAGYFLIVWDIVNFCREHGILVQGRGSAANSAVCYSLGITAVDPVGMDLLFERFLSEERGEWPDIDLDLPSGEQRERVIKWLYSKYGKSGAAMTANVITYRGRSAAREIGKALGFDLSTLSRLSSLINVWEWKDPKENAARHFADAGLDLKDPRIKEFFQLYQAAQDLPRHLGQHSGGMVICFGQLDSVVPLQPASMPGRVVLQWDKDDCAEMGILKVDLLGLGMMAVLEDTLSIIRSEYGEEVDLAHLPQDDPAVYKGLRQADTIGVFQVESRAQMATLPRIQPGTFYDIVVQVAIIRPGPIVGKMVHPYLKRRQGKEPVEYLHPDLEPVLKRTLGVPLFQEQLLRMAMICAGFSGGEAEELRRAFGFKRSEQRMQHVEKKLRKGMTKRGIVGKQQDRIVQAITSFALYGFPESHAASFALLAYASAYLRCHYPAAFHAALLNNQPMGFYHPATIVKDAQRHGLRFRPIDVSVSDWDCTVESVEDKKSVRLGLRYIKGLREKAARAIVEARQSGPFRSIEEFSRRVPALSKSEIASLAAAGALNFIEGNSPGFTRRDALWQVERLKRPAGELLQNLDDSMAVSPLKSMTEEERINADFHYTDLTIARHPMALRRAELARNGTVRAVDLKSFRNGENVRVAGHVIARQRPGTAKGFVFISLEDETGISNIIITPSLFDRHRSELINNRWLLVDGIVQNADRVISVKATEIGLL
ncbi:MAG: error-prone DNA polymerase [Acidobacteria bacterium]|nr:error-prone DNA polymerase [Acidobacteriota bacterium]